jgi:hypothetical protein
MRRRVGCCGCVLPGIPLVLLGAIAGLLLAHGSGSPTSSPTSSSPSSSSSGHFRGVAPTARSAAGAYIPEAKRP